MPVFDPGMGAWPATFPDSKKKQESVLPAENRIPHRSVWSGRCGHGIFTAMDV
jgi:hypothetical protein